MSRDRYVYVITVQTGCCQTMMDVVCRHPIDSTSRLKDALRAMGRADSTVLCLILLSRPSWWRRLFRRSAS